MRVLVVGSSNGIGKSVVEHFIAKDIEVLGVDIEGPSVQHTKFKHLPCDLSDSRQVEDLANRLSSQIITDVVYCAAEQRIFSTLQPDYELFQRMLTINISSAWQLIAKLQSAYIVQNSPLHSVVLVTSVHAFATSRSIAGYAATKAALSSLVRSLAIDFSPQKTRVNGIAPGAVKTRLLTEHLSDQEIEAYAKRQLIDHVADPREIASVIAFLMSKDASYITGQNVVADGGILSLLATESV